MSISCYIEPSECFDYKNEDLYIIFNTLLNFKEKINKLQIYEFKSTHLFDFINEEFFLCFIFDDYQTNDIIQKRNKIFYINSGYEELYNFELIELQLKNIKSIIKNYAEKKEQIIVGIVGKSSFITKVFSLTIYKTLIELDREIYYLVDTIPTKTEKLEEVFYEKYKSGDFDSNYAIHTMKNMFGFSNIDHYINTIPAKFETNVNFLKKPTSSLKKIEFDGDLDFYENKNDYFFDIENDVNIKIEEISEKGIFIENIGKHKTKLEETDILLYLTKIVRLKAIIRISKYNEIKHIDIYDKLLEKSLIENKLNINDLIFDSRYETPKNMKLVDLFGLFSNYSITSPDFFINKIRFYNIKSQCENSIIVKSNDTDFILCLANEENKIKLYMDDLFNNISKFKMGLNVSIIIQGKSNYKITKIILNSFYNLDEYIKSNITEIIFSPKNHFFPLYKKYFFEEIK